MIQVSHVTYKLPEKTLFDDISFTLEDGRHGALIGANGAGKSTLIDLLLHGEDYLFRGRVKKDGCERIGYVDQFSQREKDREVSVFDYLSEDFLHMQQEMDELCLHLETEADMERYQTCLDRFDAVDGYQYETNIRKLLKTAGLEQTEALPLSSVSGGEYKLVQIIRQMLRLPDLLIMDEPDVFLDFENLRGLGELINGYRGTVLTATHNRYLLNHCFDQILQLENGALQSFEGRYPEFALARLQLKIDLQELSRKESDFIAYEETLVERLRDEAEKYPDIRRGRVLRARVSYLERWKARHTEEPYIEDRFPNIRLPEGNVLPEQTEDVLTVRDYGVSFASPLLQNVSFSVSFGEKVALVGPNGSGKTTLLRSLYEGRDPAFSFAPGVKLGFLSQFHGETLPEAVTVREFLSDKGLIHEEDALHLMAEYCLSEELLERPIRTLSGGEKNLLQLAALSLGEYDLLLLDEPTSHLDLRSQLCLEKAVREYRGTVLMVSHDFSAITGCTDYVLYFDEGTVRKVSARAFRKMIYKRYFPQKEWEWEQRKKEAELTVSALLLQNKTEEARKACRELEELLSTL